MSEELLDANAAQRRYWNTVAGPRWVAAPGFRERRNQESTALLLARLGITGGENVLEIGCGTGALTVPLAAAIGNHGRLVAIDISEPMLGVARQHVQDHGLHNVKLLLGDAQVFDFEPGAFDLATSRMGVMFFANPTAAFRNIGGGLKPGGRLTFACWGPLQENPHWLISYDIALRHLGSPAPQPANAPSPLAFADRLTAQRTRPMRFIAARHDLTFPADLSRDVIARVRDSGVPLDVTWLPCGHYTSGERPWVYLDGWKIVAFLRKNL